VVKVSILVPVYNERYLVGECLRRVLAAPLPPRCEREVVVVDDASTDGTSEILAGFGTEIRLIRHDKNLGKGGAVRTAIGAASGDILLIQDADLEYDPADYPALLQPLLSGQADAVFGSRFSGDRRRVLMFWHTLGNRALTFVSNMFTGLDLTDMWACYKAISAAYLKGMPLRCDGFSIEPELTAKLAKKRARIYEVPISYHGRGYDEGKKIGVWDAVRSIFVILRFWLIDDLYGDDRWGQKILHELDKATRFNDWMADAVRPWLGARVLEVGAGIGNLTAKLCRRDAYFATDVDKAYCLHLERRFANRPEVRVLQLDVTRDASVEKVDSVVCLNVLEHLDDDLGVVKRMASFLSPGGDLILLVPNLPQLYGSIDELAGHKRRYTKTGLAALLREAGLEPESIVDFNRVSTPAWIWNTRILRRKTFSRIQLKAFDSLVWLFRRIDRFFPWPGQSLIAVGRRPAPTGEAPAAPHASRSARSA
jgi:glycosyltransferase involved in cell wall biosynthesis